MCPITISLAAVRTRAGLVLVKAPLLSRLKL